ncbi:MAG: hypothetical protein K5656_04795 [Lachnospiraceae bacterium]|nr:hypothetical protein [Lachnospiraceae bacterium]
MSSTYEYNSLKAEYNSLVADLRSLKEERDEVKFKLDNEQFHLDQLPFRKSLTDTQASRAFLLTIISFSATILFILSTLILIRQAKALNDAGMVIDEFTGICFGASIIGLIAAIIFTVYYSIKSSPLLKQYIAFRKTPASEISLGVTFSEDKKITEGKIRRLKSDIDDLDRLITDRELDIDKIKKRMNELGYEIPINPYATTKSKSFGSADYRDSGFSTKGEYLTNEQLDTRIHEDNLDLERLGRLIEEKKKEEFRLDDEINQVIEKFMIAKQNMIIFAAIIIASIMLSLATSWIPGVKYIFPVIGLTTFAILIIKYLTKYEKDFDNYFVEKEFDFFKGYAFQHDLVPISHAKKEVSRERKNLENDYHKTEERLENWINEKANRDINK